LAGGAQPRARPPPQVGAARVGVRVDEDVLWLGVAPPVAGRVHGGQRGLELHRRFTAGGGQPWRAA